MDNVPNAELAVQVGQKYLFYQGDVSNSLLTPPQLVFSKVRNTTSEKYLLRDAFQVSGIPGRSDSYTLLTVTSDLPEVFYYENLNTPGKGGTIRISARTLTTFI